LELYLHPILRPFYPVVYFLVQISKLRLKLGSHHHSFHVPCYNRPPLCLLTLHIR
jgi:hypothetical protein